MTLLKDHTNKVPPPVTPQQPQPHHHHHHGIKNLFRRDTGNVTPTDSHSSINSSSSHIGLSKLFHHSHKDHHIDSDGNRGGNGAVTPPKRTQSSLSLRRRNTNPINQHSQINNSNNSPTNINSNSNSNNSLSSLNNALKINRNRANSELNHNNNPSSTNLINNMNNLNLNNGNIPHKKLTKAETFAHMSQLDSRNAAKQQLRNTRIPTNQSQISSTPAHSSSNHEKIVYNPYGMIKTPSQEQPKSTSFYLSGVNDGERVLANPVANPNDYLPENLQETHINLLDDYDIDVSNKKLGDGGSSDVRIINSCNDKKKLYALKKFTLLSKESDEEFYKRVAKEYIIHKKTTSNQHVVDVYGIIRIQSQANLTRGWGMVMEYCNNGDLFSMIIRSGWKKSPLMEKYCFFKQISKGLKFIHDQDIAHRDIKPENVLIDARGCCKLCDFGVSDYQHEIPGDFNSPIKLSTSYVGSPPYSPPEVMLLKEKSHNEIKNFAYNMFKADCWGLGMLLFCMIYSGVPFQQASPLDHGYRDYQFNHKRFCTDHQNFKNNKGINKGPGSEFKLAAKFESSGASRVAWKLCDPSTVKRYDLDMLFDDPWFKSIEICDNCNDDLGGNENGEEIPHKKIVHDHNVSNVANSGRKQLCL